LFCRKKTDSNYLVLTEDTTVFEVIGLSWILNLIIRKSHAESFNVQGGPQK